MLVRRSECLVKFGSVELGHGIAGGDGLEGVALTSDAPRQDAVRGRRPADGVANDPLDVGIMVDGIRLMTGREIEDVAGVTLCAASSLDKEFNGNGGNKTGAREVGKLIAARAAEKGISEVVFDRGGYIFHGRVKELADGAREGGLNF